MEESYGSIRLPVNKQVTWQLTCWFITTGDLGEAGVQRTDG